VMSGFLATNTGRMQNAVQLFLAFLNFLDP